MEHNELIVRSMSGVAKAHENQKYGEEFPYFIHLWAAYIVARRFGIEDPVILAAVLWHDYIEDVAENDMDGYKEIVSLLNNSEVADIVLMVTNPRGMNRKMKHLQSYPIIRQDGRARIVKLCDRISHVEFGGKMVGMYRKEHPAFKEALGASNPLSEVEGRMWDHLDKLFLGCANRIF